MIYGKPGKALEKAKQLRQRKLPGEAGRSWLLSGEALLTLGDFSGALVEAKAALANFPASTPYYRARARLLLSQILLAAPHLGKAGPHIKDALRICQSNSYLPLLTRAHTLHARWLLDHASPQKARASALRALQLGQQVERPLSHCETLRILGQIETKTGRIQAAIGHLKRALLVLKEARDSCPPEYQSSFSRCHAEPIELDLLRIRGFTVENTSGILSSFNQFLGTVKSTETVEGIGQTVLRCAKREIPKLSATIFLRPNPRSQFSLIGSTGHCLRSGRTLLRDLDAAKSPPVLPSQFRGRSALGFPITGTSQVYGLLYTEWLEDTVREVDFDFLQCLAQAAVLPLRGPIIQEKEPPTFPRGLPLSVDRFVVGESPAMQRVFEKVRRIASSKAAVLIYGETGTGKELIARSLHYLSQRRKGRWIPYNCASDSAELTQNELFGHEKGSYTGATTAAVGLIEAANHGTLFLDEIGSMPLQNQPRLLRFLDDQKIRRIGARREISVDVRIISATNQRLQPLIQAGTFREDLYHRINVIQLNLPPLRDRPTDIPLLAQNFLGVLNQRDKRQVRLSKDTLRRIQRYRFPGNVRELKNLIKSLYYSCREDLITPRDLDEKLSFDDSRAMRPEVDPVPQVIDELANGVSFWTAVKERLDRHDLTRNHVRRIIAYGLEICGGNYRKLVSFLNMDESHYKRFMRYLGKIDCKVDFRPYRQSASRLRR
jgi:DNA-binding NtrC family response regulator